MAIATVTVNVPTLLRGHTGGERVVVAEGRTLREVLDDLDRRYPGFARDVLAEDGAPRGYMNLYVNEEDVRYLGVLETEVGDGDTVSILPAVAGGR
jgi:molybdopterin synthase sulfur carrier subunit